MTDNESQDLREPPGLALKIGIAGALAIGAAASGFLLSRQGRRVVREAWQGRRRTRIEDRALEALWHDRTVGRRPLDVQESEGTLIVSGRVRSRAERDRVLDILDDLEGVEAVEDRLAIEPRQSRVRVPRRMRV